MITWHDYVSHSPVAGQHRPSVQQHDEDSNDSKHERVPGLGIRPCRAVHLEVEQGRDEEAAPCCVEHGGQNDCDRQYTNEVRTE